MNAFAKGVQGAVQRATLLPFRYGISPEKLRARLSRMAAFLERWDAKPTIPVTAVLLRRHPGLVPALKGMDPAIHGFNHVAYAAMSLTEQANDLDLALDAFGECGLQVRGFRSPYLQPSAGTLDLLKKRSFLFDSSFTQYTLPRTHPAHTDASRLVAMRYGVKRSSEPPGPPDRGLVELPVALPDDEILVDAMGLRSPSALWSIYQAMLIEASKDGGILVVQLHPERFGVCEDALAMLMTRASDDGAWIPSLTEAAEWVLSGHGKPRSWPKGRPYAISITGDLDAVALGDFASRFLGA